MSFGGSYTPGIYHCCMDGCSYCHGTGVVVVLSGDTVKDAIPLRYLSENAALGWNPKIIQPPSEHRKED